MHGSEPLTHLFVGFSGGVDSTALLLLAKDYANTRADLQLTAVHVNHDVNPSADAWERHCEQICRSLDVPLNTHKLEHEEAENNLESALRTQRYAVFRRAVKGLDSARVLLAHHSEDQTETILLRLLQGRSLEAMTDCGDVLGVPVLRPLLPFNKADLKAFVASRGCAWIEDDSNANTDFDRNFLRLEILPALYERFVSLDARVQRVATYQQSMRGALVELMPEELSADLVTRDLLSGRVLLRLFLERQGEYEVTDKALEEFQRQIVAGDRAKVALPGGAWLVRDKDRVRLKK